MDVVVDDDEVDEIDKGLEEIGVGRATPQRKTSAAVGASIADTNFIERFEKEKEIERELKLRVSDRSPVTGLIRMF